MEVSPPRCPYLLILHSEFGEVVGARVCCLCIFFKVGARLPLLPQRSNDRGLRWLKNLAQRSGPVLVNEPRPCSCEGQRIQLTAQGVLQSSQQSRKLLWRSSSRRLRTFIRVRPLQAPKFELAGQDRGNPLATAGTNLRTGWSYLMESSHDRGAHGLVVHRHGWPTRLLAGVNCSDTGTPEWAANPTTGGRHFMDRQAPLLLNLVFLFLFEPHVAFVPLVSDFRRSVSGPRKLLEGRLRACF